MDQISEAAAWSLRKVLQADPRFMLLGTALRSFVAGRPLDTRRALAIRVLPGGSPRLVVLLADLTQGTTLRDPR